MLAALTRRADRCHPQHNRLGRTPSARSPSSSARRSRPPPRRTVTSPSSWPRLTGVGRRLLHRVGTTRPPRRRGNPSAALVGQVAATAGAGAAGRRPVRRRNRSGRRRRALDQRGSGVGAVVATSGRRASLFGSPRSACSPADSCRRRRRATRPSHLLDQVARGGAVQPRRSSSSSGAATYVPAHGPSPVSPRLRTDFVAVHPDPA